MTTTKREKMNTEHSYYYSLELEGINGFKDRQILNLSNKEGNFAQWTIILGDNGTGKTTLLRVLDRMQPVEKKIRGEQNYKPWLAVDYLYYPFFQTKKTEVKLNFEQGVHFLFKSNQEGVDIYGHDKVNTFLISYGASRRMNRNPNIFKINEELNLTSLFDESLELINVEEWYLQKFLAIQTSINKIKEKSLKQLGMIRMLLIDFMPEVLNIRIREIRSLTEKSSLEVQINESEWIDLQDLSFGYQTITALLVDIASKMMTRYPESENPLHEPVIILIDEIDLHLHPKWQRTVIDKLTEHFPKAQFIVTAHSPLIAQAAEDKNANIVVCRKEGDKIVIDNSPESVKGWRVDQILTSELFDVGSSRSKSTQDHIDEYIKLKGRENLNPEQRKRLEELTLIVGEAYSKNTNQELDKKLQDFANRFLK